MQRRGWASVPDKPLYHLSHAQDFPTALSKAAVEVGRTHYPFNSMQAADALMLHHLPYLQATCYCAYLAWFVLRERRKKASILSLPNTFRPVLPCLLPWGRDSVWAEKDHMRGQRRTGDEVELPCDFFAFGSAPMICPIRSSLSLAGFPGMSWLIRSQRLAEATL